MIVKNEDRFVWYAVNSTLPYVDRFIIFDTGSTDKTVAVIKTIKSGKIDFYQKYDASSAHLSSYRKEQADMVKKGWLWLVDADEVYPRATAATVVAKMNSPSRLPGIIVRRYDLLGDIYHYQRETVGSYSHFGITGHYVLRCLDKDTFTNIEVLGNYPREYFAEKGKPVIDLGKAKFFFVEKRIFHAAYLIRSTAGSILFNTLNRRKYKIELGLPVNRGQQPEIFSAPRPDIVPDVTGKRSLTYMVAASILTPVKIAKRKLFSLFNSLI